MTAALLPEAGFVSETKIIEVMPAIFDHVHELITPTRAVDRFWRSEHYPLVARILLKYPDGSQTEVYVRWAGQNPAVVSLDDKQYFHAERGCVGDGAGELRGLLLGLRR